MWSRPHGVQQVDYNPYFKYQYPMKGLLLTLALLLAAFAQKTPVWPVRFQQEFVESYASTQYHDVGRLWFDSERGMERLDRGNGKYNPFCNSITNATTPCTQLVREQKRYIYFPLLRLCCFCCDAAHGCGIMKRDWLSASGAKYVGKDELSGQVFDKWTESDTQSDYWATTDARQVPRKHAEGNQFFKDFIMNTYSEEYINESIFALPSYCTGTACPATSRCAKFTD